MGYISKDKKDKTELISHKAKVAQRLEDILEKAKTSN